MRQRNFPRQFFRQGNEIHNFHAGITQRPQVRQKLMTAHRRHRQQDGGSVVGFHQFSQILRPPQNRKPADAGCHRRNPASHQTSHLI